MKQDDVNPPSNDGALNIDEFCAEYRVGRSTVYEQINAGRLPAVKVGRRTLIPRSGARDWFQSLPSLAPAPPTLPKQTIHNAIKKGI
jgi:excisionase family DNA binding protein